MGVKLGVFNTAIYEKLVRGSFKSFEQCSKSLHKNLAKDILF